MQSDLFDKKIRAAADHHHPAYDEHAWKKMKKQLDRHMPEEKERRRGLFLWIFFFLLLGGGTLLMTNRPWENKKVQGIATRDDSADPRVQKKITPTPGEQVQGVDPAPDPDRMEIGNPSKTTENSEKKPQQREKIKPVVNKDKREFGGSGISPAGKDDKDQETGPVEKKGDPVAGVDQPAMEKMQKPQSDQIESPEKASVEPAGNKDDKSQEEQGRKVKEAGKKNKKTQTLASRFFFFGSTGPDFSFTGSGSPGKVTLMAGVGAGFQLNDRVMIRSGFFSGRKLYEAKPRDYDPPPQFWNYYPNMQKIDADCRVYELPLLISYRFGRSTKESWFATTGISSYFMKEEKYKYYYKPYPNSPTYTRDYTIRDRFEHHFSVLTISAGYKRNIGKRLSVMAEPYYKVPLDGIGFGKVKLNSGGVLFSVGVRPFGR